MEVKNTWKKRGEILRREDRETSREEKQTHPKKVAWKNNGKANGEHPEVYIIVFKDGLLKSERNCTIQEGELIVAMYVRIIREAEGKKAK